MDKKTLINKAFLHLRDGRWQDAVSAYQSLLESHPEDPGLMNLLGDALLGKGRIIDAIQAFRQAYQVYQRQDESSRASLMLTKMGRIDPNSVDELKEGRPRADVSSEDAAGFEEAITAAKAELSRDPKSLERQQKVGDLLAKAGRIDEAAQSYLSIGNALYNARQFAKAGPVYKHVIELDPGNLQARIALGEIYSKEGSDSEAKKEFLMVAETLIRQGNLDRGQLFAQKAIQLKSIEAHYYMGLVHFLKGKGEEARSEFETLLKFKVNHQGALTHLAHLLGEAGELDDAQGLLERLIKLDRNNAKAKEDLARLLLKRGESKAAREHFNEAMNAYAAQEEWERTAICAHEALKLDSENVELYLKLADAAYAAGLEDQAAEACNALGDVYEAQGQAAEAQAVRRKAAEILGQAPSAAPSEHEPAPKSEKPLSQADETKVMMNIAATYIRQGSLDEAIEIYQKILQADPNNAAVKEALTRAYATFAGVNPEKAVAKQGGKAGGGEEQRLQREARERAQREAQIRSQRRPTQEPSRQSKSASVQDDLSPVGDQQEDEIAGDHQDEFMTVTVAEIYTKQGLLNEALKIYQKILEIEPGNLEAQAKKRELEKTMSDQERLRKETAPHEPSKADPSKAGGSGRGETGEKMRKPAAAEKAGEKPEAPADADAKDSKPGRGKHKGSDDDDGPPRQKRSRVSYV